MDELHLLGVHEDGEHLLLATADGRQRFSLPLNDALRAAVRWERGHRAGAAAEDGEPLRPVDVQAMIRAGATAEEVAERANWTVEKVRRYESPILAERAYMATEAGRAHVRSRVGPVQLAERVAQRFEVRGVSAETVAWDSWRDEEGQWTVEVRFAAGGRQRTASWHFDKGTMTVSARDDEARWLSDDGAEPEPTVQHVVPMRGRVYDVEAEGGLRSPARTGAKGDTGTKGTKDGKGTAPNDEVTLMTAMRERSTARRRRGQRKSPAASPTALPPLGDASVVEAPPLAELRYDPATMPPPPAAHGEPETEGIDGRPEPAAVADRLAGTDQMGGFDDDEPDHGRSPEAAEADVAQVAADDAAEVGQATTPRPLASPAPVRVGEPAPEPVAALPPYRVSGDSVAEPELPLDSGPGTAESATTTAPEQPTEPVAIPEENQPADEHQADDEHQPGDEHQAGDEQQPGDGDQPTDRAPATAPAPETARTRSGQRNQPSRSSRSRRKGRASVPAWDDIMFGAQPGQDD